MLNFIDNFLNKTTMYRLVLYVLISFLVAALLLSSFFNVLRYGPVDLLISFGIILTISWVTNFVFYKVFEAPANAESVYITALILFFIITPIETGNVAAFLPLAFWASVWAMAAKYIFAIRKKHIFNPAAIAVVLTAIFLNQSASWWIGTRYMLPIVLVGGLLIARKLRRNDLLLGFLGASLVTISVLALLKGGNPLSDMQLTIIDSPFIFFAFIMLTEPLTTPPTRWLRVAYGAVVGLLFAPALHVGFFYSTPEMALVLGNIFSYAVSPKEKLILKLKERVQVAKDTFDFVFTNTQRFIFRPGQYLEWTLAHRSPDLRGNRRYFTIASSPTDQDIRMGIRFYPEPSSFKNRLLALPIGSEIVASQLAGDFVLPDNKDQKLVFIAGGIGVTPFRSMIGYLLALGEKRSIALLYSNKTAADVAYKDLFDRAGAELGIKTVYAITDAGNIPPGWKTRQGMIDAKMISEEVPDYRERTFYISGPHAMVAAFESTLKVMGVPGRQIKTDFFPGFA